jgi:hypothetical protein
MSRIIPYTPTHTFWLPYFFVISSITCKRLSEWKNCVFSSAKSESCLSVLERISWENIPVFRYIFPLFHSRSISKSSICPISTQERKSSDSKRSRFWRIFFQTNLLLPVISRWKARDRPRDFACRLFSKCIASTPTSSSQILPPFFQNFWTIG